MPRKPHLAWLALAVAASCTEDSGDDSGLGARARPARAAAAAQVVVPVADGRARRPVALQERAPEPGGSDEPTGVCFVRLDAPAGVSTWADVDIVDERPDGFLSDGDVRVLHGTCGGGLSWLWDPSTSIADDDPEEPDEPQPELHDGRIHVELCEEDLPLGRPLWACLSSVGPSGYGARGFPPQVVAIPPLASPAEPARVSFSLAPLGAVALRVEAPAPGADGDPTAGELGDAAPAWIDEVALRLLGGPSQWRDPERGALQLWPLDAGRCELDAIAQGDGHSHRRLWSVTVRDGETTDLGTWRPEATTPALELVAVDESGARAHGWFEVEVGGWPAVPVCVDDEGRARLWGDWAGVRRLAFVPEESEVFEPAAVAPEAVVAGRATVVIRRRETRLVRFMLRERLPDGSLVSEPAWALARSAAGGWLPTELGWASGCTGWHSSPFPPGLVEVAAWLPERGLAYVGPLDVSTPRRVDDTEMVELPFEDPRTAARGTLRVTCAGLEVEEAVDLWPAPRGGSTPGEASSIQRHWPRPWRFDPGPFELRGLPPDLALDLVACDDQGAELTRVPLRLQRGEVLDLGLVEVALR